MKKALLAVFVISTLISSAYAYGSLTGQRHNGTKKICFYSDDSIITVESYELCPLSID